MQERRAPGKKAVMPLKNTDTELSILLDIEN